MTNVPSIRCAWEFKDSILSQEKSVQGVIGELLAHITCIDPTIQAFEWVLAEAALQRAAELDDKIDQGSTDPLPLVGLPVVLTDSEALKNQPMTYGSRLLRHHKPAYSSGIAQRLLDVGAVILGKTRVAEFGFGAWTESAPGLRTRSPWDIRHPVAGPSGAGAAAVATGMAACAVEADTFGSLRLASAQCGVFGIKTGRGRIPQRDATLHPPAERKLTQHGVIGRSVRDCIEVLNTLTPLEGDRIFENKSPIQAAWSGDLGYIASEPTVISTVEMQLKRLAAIDIYVDPIDLKISADSLVHLRHLLAADRYLPIIDLCAPFPDFYKALSSSTQEWLAVGNRVTGVQYSVAYSYMRCLKQHILDRMEGVDVLFTPVSPYANPGERSLFLRNQADTDGSLQACAFLLPFNLCGFPAMTLPLGLSECKLPMAVQVVARPGDEERLLQIALSWEQHQGFTPPPIQGFIKA